MKRHVMLVSVGVNPQPLVREGDRKGGREGIK